jgi:CRP-like cAMP-binding protein
VQSGGGWFARLPESERVALFRSGVRRTYRSGSTLFHENDLSDWVVVISQGRVKVSVTTADGREVVLAICGPGEILGELSAVDSGPRSATATAVEPVEAQIITRLDFLDYLTASPNVTIALLKSLSGRVRDSDRRRVEFVALDTVGRVAAQLLELAATYGVATEGGATRVDLPISQEDLAGLTGSSREAVGKALQLFRQRGWVRTARRSITILDPGGLGSRAT